MKGRNCNLGSLLRLFLAIFAISTSQRSDGYILPVANALSSLKLNANGQPRLCSIVEGSVNGFTRLCFGKARQKEIRINALSNRNVLRGKFESLQVSIQESQSSVLAFDSFTMQGNNLNFGYLPLAIVVGLPTFFWLVSARMLLYILFVSFVWRNQREYLFSPERIKAMEEGIQRQQQKLSKFLLGSGPCQLNYTISMSNQSLKNSAWVQILAKSLVQSFMANSALPLAAAVSDATNNLMLLESSTSATSRPNSNLKNASDNNAILALWKQQEQQQSLQPASAMTPSFPLTELFAATSFELRESPIFAKDGHIWLPCVANLPDTSKSKLEFTLRTKPTVAFNLMDFAFSQESQASGGLEFTAAECSLNVGSITSNTPEWAKQFLPSVVWLPIGSNGMVLPVIGGKMNQWKRITVQDNFCQLHGEVDLFRASRNTISSDQSGGIGKTFGNLLRQVTKLDERKVNNDDRPKLPGGK